MQKDFKTTNKPKTAIAEQKNGLEDSIFQFLSKDSERQVDYKGNLIQLSRDLLHNKYYDTFNFYFSKPINEIIAGVGIPHVISYRDLLYYDDEREYLKRFYKKIDMHPRMQKITDFYETWTDGMIRPNLMSHSELYPLLAKRDERFNKFLLSKLKNIAGIFRTHRNVNQLPNDHILANARENSRANIIQNKENSIKVASPDSKGYDIYKDQDSSSEEIHPQTFPNSTAKTGRTRRKDINRDIILNSGLTHPNILDNQDILQLGKFSEAPQIGENDSPDSKFSLNFCKDLSSPGLEDKKEEMLEIVNNPIEANNEKINKYSNQDSVSFSNKGVFSNACQHNDSQPLESPKVEKYIDQPEVEETPFFILGDEIESIPNADPPKLSKPVKDQGSNTNHESSVTHLFVSADKAPEEMKYPCITIQNIQIHQFASPQNQKIDSLHQIQPQPQRPSLKDSSKIKYPSLSNNTPPLTYSTESYPHPIETIFTEESVERERRNTLQNPPRQSAEYVKELMKKHYKLSEGEVKQLSQPITERFKQSTIFSRLLEAKQKAQKGKEETKTSPRKTPVVYNPTQLEYRAYYKERSNTDVTLSQNIQETRTYLDTLPDGQSSIGGFAGSLTTRTQTSPLSNRKSNQRVKSNEGIFNDQESGSRPLPIHKSPRNSRSIGEFMSIETLASLNRITEDRKTADQQRIQYKQQQMNKTKSLAIYQQIVQKTGIAVNHKKEEVKRNGSLTANKKSSQPNSNSGSLSRKFDFKLDLTKVSHVPKTETSQGFWSSRSGKNEESAGSSSNTLRFLHSRNPSQFYKDHSPKLTTTYSQRAEAKEKQNNLVTYSSKLGFSGNVTPKGNSSSRNTQQQKKTVASIPQKSQTQTSDLRRKFIENKISPSFQLSGAVPVANRQFTLKKIGK